MTKREKWIEHMIEELEKHISDKAHSYKRYVTVRDEFWEKDRLSEVQLKLLEAIYEEVC